MANGSIANPAYITDPGVLYWAPVGSTLPTPAVVGGVFTDTWPVAWIPLGMTDAGTSFQSTITTSPITAAETMEPLAYRTTDRASQVTFSLKSYTATNLARAMNGATLTVTGTAGTTLTKVTPPAIGAEVRCMIGFESLDNTYRFIGYQAFNSGQVKRDFNKAPATAVIPFTLMLEKPASGIPFEEWTAGTARA